MKRFCLLFILSIFLLLASCKNDSSPLDNNQSIEDIYFHDYQSPKEKWGYMDMKGSTVIKPIYDDVRDMKSKLTAANKKGRWGYINQQGDKVIDFQYKQVLDFNDSGDRTIVQDFHNDWLLIDQNDNVVDSLPYDDYKSCVNGFYPVAYKGQWGLMNISGKEVIAPAYNSIKPIGKFCIAKKDDKYGIISLSGEVLMPLDYKRIDVNDGKYLKVTEVKTTAFYNFDLEKISPDYNKPSRIEDGLFFIKSSNGYYTVLNSLFQKTIEIKADKIEYANDGIWKYKRNGKWGLMDSNGTPITKPKYDLMNKFQEGLILYSNNDQWGYMEKDGSIFIPAKLPIAWNFKDGLARVLHSKGCGFINKDKTMVIDKRIFEVRDFYNGLARYQTM